MPSTVYKGDLAEVSFAPEVGISLICAAGNDCTFVLSHPSDDHSKLVLTGANTQIFATNNLKYPDGMLVGSQLKFTRSGGTAIVDGDLNVLFTIVGNDGPNLFLSPKMLTGANTINDANVTLHILPYKTPPFDSTMSEGAGSERVLTDQFLGITNALTVPETKVDLKRFHVVGLGRDTSVQVPGKMTTEGGSFEVAMHSARWLKYCLGGEVVHPVTDPEANHLTTLDGATNAGQSFITITDDETNLAVKHYVLIVDTEYIPVTTTHDVDVSDADLRWAGTFSDSRFDSALRSEVRRVIGIDGKKVYLDEPLLFPHADNKAVQFIDFSDLPNTNPPTVSATGVVANAQTHLLFNHTHQPSFSLEVSQRRRDMDSDEGTVDGSQTDSKELTRVFRGCKVTDFTLTTDNDAALRLAVNFNAALCYTDTGRLEGTPITRYSSHRMFNDTANTDVKRFQSGIGPKTQKPFMFYNGTINIAGVQAAQVLNFSLTGQTGMQAFHTIGGQSSINTATEQVPFGGSRNTTLMVEGQTSYEMTMEIGVDDPLFYHKMRSATEFVGTTDGTVGNQIRINFEKNTTTGTTERMMIIIDDYYIIEAPLQIPEDKGMVKSTLKIMPKTIKVIARDTIVKY